VLEAALAAGAPIESVYFSPDAEDAASASAVIDAASARGIRTFPLHRGVLEQIADTVTPQPVVAVIGRIDVPLDELLAAAPAGTPLVVCVDVRDPGNLGAITRSADAAGAAGVICCDGSADPYNPKTVRASAGSLFNVPLTLDVDVDSVLTVLSAAGYLRVGTVARAGIDYGVAELAGRVALVFGNEAHGLPAAVAARLDTVVTIPMSGGAESLNVAMAATVLLFDLARQRRAGTGPGDATEPLR